MSPQQKFGAAMSFGQRRTLAIVLGLKIEDEHPDTSRVDPTPISDDQAIYLADLVKESGTNLERLLKHFEITSLEQLPTVSYNEAVAVCKERQQRKAGRQ